MNITRTPDDRDTYEVTCDGRYLGVVSYLGPPCTRPWLVTIQENDKPVEKTFEHQWEACTALREALNGSSEG